MEKIRIEKINDTTGIKENFNKNIENRKNFIKEYFKKDFSAFNIEYLDFIEHKRDNLEIYQRENDDLMIYFLAA